jgi:hypothetical protein
MMNRPRYLFVAMIAVAVGAQIFRAQQPADHNRRHKGHAVDGVVESVGGRLQVSLINNDSAGSVSGAARISLSASDRLSEVARFEFTLAPQESRLYPLDSGGAPGDQYTLAVYERGGALILLKNAPIKRGQDTTPVVEPSPPPAIPSPVTTTLAVAKELTIKARLAAGRPGQQRRVEALAPAAEQPNQLQSNENTSIAPAQPSDRTVIKKPSAKYARRGESSEPRPVAVERQNTPPIGKIEAPINDELDSLILVFDIAAPAPIINASLSVSANGLKDRQTVNIRGAGSAEFKLPDDFFEPTINYTLTDASGKTLIAGELDFEALRMEDSVRLSDIKFNQESYTPGQSAQIVVTLEGRSPTGYLLEVTASNEDGSIILSDSRKGVYNNGKSMQEFKVDVPAEAKGGVIVRFKAFGRLTKKIFDSDSRELIINDAEKDNDNTDNRDNRDSSNL